MTLLFIVLCFVAFLRTRETILRAHDELELRMSRVTAYYRTHGASSLPRVVDGARESRYTTCVEPDATFDDVSFYRAVHESGARALLIGRRALIVYGLPVATFDYDLWIHIDDIEVLNPALEALDHVPNRSPGEARARGRYVFENGERIDVLVVRASTTKSGITLSFEDAWARRIAVPYVDDVAIQVPCLDDLILTKRWAMRAKDIADIQLLEALRRDGATP